MKELKTISVHEAAIRGMSKMEVKSVPIISTFLKSEILNLIEILWTLSTRI